MSNEQQECRQIVLPDVPGEVTSVSGSIWLCIFKWHRGAVDGAAIDSAIISAMRAYATEAVRQDRASRPVGAMDRAEVFAAIKTLQGLGYTWNGGELWRPPLGKAKAAPDADGWIEWKGGPRPVDPETMVQVRLRSDQPGCYRAPGPAKLLAWEHDLADPFGDIVAYRIISCRRTPDTKPASPAVGQTWWVGVKGNNELRKAKIIRLSDAIVQLSIDLPIGMHVTAYRRSAVEFVEVCNG